MLCNFNSYNNSQKRYFWVASSYLLVIAALIGLGTGFAAIGFKKLIGFFHMVFFSGGEKLLINSLSNYYITLIPALGGLLVGPIIYFLAREAKGHGVPEVMAAIAEKEGILRPRVVLVKAFASAITIGSGGSAGREGPIVQVSAAIGSTVGQILKMPPSILKTLVACGAAGGISATFNAPIGGVLFAQEVILGEFATSNFILIVISSVISAMISRAFWSDNPAFMVPVYELVSPTELLFYLVLGILAGVIAVLFIKFLYKTEDIFDSINIVPEYIKPVIGGLLIGSIGLYFPQIFGVGYETVEEVLKNNIPWILAFLLLFVKLAATSLTIGSGGSGGVFAPSLFMGSMLGGSFGYLIHTYFPTITAPAGAYALVGMGGVFAGVAQAPITGIIMLFEMTGDYKVVLPLMMVCVISSLVARGLHSDTIYTEKLSRRGLNVRQKEKVDIMANMPVSQVMTTSVVTLDAGMELNSARDIILQNAHTGYPVISQGLLVGIVTYEDVLKGLKSGQEKLSLGQLVTNNLITVTPNCNIRTVMDKMARGDVGRLLVVDPQEPRKLLGIISRSDIINAYAVATRGEGVGYEISNFSGK